jgi:NAD(P)-dependent dehydrogenase (short-subunit alcohol dehydrogenase family)
LNNSLIDADGRVLLLSGASGGVGQAICERYVAAGGRVAALDTAAPPNKDGVLHIRCDMGDEDAIGRAIAAARGEFGRIDALIHAAGVVGEGELAALSLAEWRRVMDTNLTSAFLLARAAYPALREAETASVVLFGSSNGVNGGSALSGAAYAASKAGIANLARYLAKEWAPHIRVNTLAPGPVNTPMLDRLSPQVMANLKQRMLTGVLIEPDEAAACALFLLSGHARSITGATLNLSGGLVLD